MVEFAVRHDGMAEGQGSWVLAVDGDRLLLADEDGSLHWHAVADCKLVKAATPDQPRAVIAVQPRQGLAIPPPFMSGNGRKLG